MRALGVDIGRKWGVRLNAGDNRRVLPPFLRRPARILSRMDWQTPRYAGTKALAAFIVVTVIAGTVIGGHSQAVITEVTTASGLAIDQVKISGQSETSEVDILDRLAVAESPSLFSFDLDDARERVESLPWVARATLRKLYPGTLEVVVAERLPYALWQNGDTVSLIDPQGTVITDYVSERYTNLPLVVGREANVRVDEFLDLVLSQPTLVPHVRAGVMVSERRWNIVVAEGVEILLPEDDPEGALARVANLDAERHLFAREVATVDVRLPDRIVLRLTERGLAERRTAIEARGGSSHRQGAKT